MVGRITQRLLHSGSRLKRRIHAATAPRSGPPPSGSARGATIDELIDLFFPDGVSAGSIDPVRHMLQTTALDASSVRRVLGTVDRQRSPSPFSVRASMADVAYVSVGGIDVALDRADQSVSAPIIRDGFWEPHVEHVLRRVLAPGSVFVDIGANVGWHSMLAASIVGATGRVVAIEPNPDNARLIAHSIAHNELTNVSLVPLALGDSIGYAAFRSAIGSNGGFVDGDEADPIAPGVTIVPTIRLDDLGIERIDVIKIDVEGAEPIVFRGAGVAIERDHPAIIFEFSCEMTGRVGGANPRDHLKMFEAYGYRLSLIGKPDGALIAVDDIDRLLADWGDPCRIEDFLAIRPGSPIAEQVTDYSPTPKNS